MIANISAWNYPYFVGGNVFVPALAAGNAVLYKPSEFATLTGMHIADMLHAAGVPEDVFIAVIGDGKTGAALLRAARRRRLLHRLVRHRRKIAASTGRRMIKTQLELGGKDPIYVTDDVDVKAAAAGRGRRRLLQHRTVVLLGRARLRPREDLRRRSSTAFVAEVKGFKVGDPLDEATYIGAITRKPQLAVLQKQVSDAKKKGARLLAGGAPIKGKGNWFAPTVLADVDHSMLVMRDESFGPIIGLQSVARRRAASSS